MKKLIILFAAALAACNGAPEPQDALNTTQPVSINADDNGYILASVQLEMKNMPKDQIVSCAGDGTSRIVKSSAGVIKYGESDVCRRSDGTFTDKKFQPLTGIVEARYEGGAIKSETGVRYGRLDGDSIIYNRDGDKVATDVFKAGVKISSFMYYPDETLRYAVGYENGEMSSITMYNEDGTLNWTSEVVDGSLNGDYRIYRDDELYAHFQMQDNLIVSGDFIEDGERKPATEAEIQEINEQLADTLSVSPVNGQF